MPKLRDVSRPVILMSAVCLLSGPIGVLAADGKPAPTEAKVRYGTHERNLLDFWQARGEAPAPLAIFIHGGGFRTGSKENLPAEALDRLLAAGISVAAINYRFRVDAPLPGAHHDARRALQFLRSQAGRLKIDKSRVGAFGGSAGAQIAMYLAFHDDLAQKESSDPVERESTRLTCVGTSAGQTTMDVGWWIENIPAYDRPHQNFPERFGLSDQKAYHAVVADTSALPLISADDPPIYMTYSMSPDDPAPEEKKLLGWQIHHVQFGVALKKKMDALGVESHLVYPGLPDRQYPGITEFLISKLTGRNPAPAAQ
jgi:pimeloyl-ACP methyl ester carboxylesterase